MAEEDEARADVLQAAKALVATAHYHGYLRKPENSTPFGQSLGSARIGLLVSAIGALQHKEGKPLVPQSFGWEFAQAFGPLVRIAVFELTSGDIAPRWVSFVVLFRHYFGWQVDPILPSIFLAAVLHPEVLPSHETCSDAAQIVRNMTPLGGLHETLRDVGLLP